MTSFCTLDSRIAQACSVTFANPSLGNIRLLDSGGPTIFGLSSPCNLVVDLIGTSTANVIINWFTEIATFIIPAGYNVQVISVSLLGAPTFTGDLPAQPIPLQVQGPGSSLYLDSILMDGVFNISSTNQVLVEVGASSNLSIVQSTIGYQMLFIASSTTNGSIFSCADRNGINIDSSTFEWIYSSTIQITNAVYVQVVNSSWNGPADTLINGGAISINGAGSVAIAQCQFTGLTTWYQGMYGGALYLSFVNTVIIEGTTFDGNTAAYGGAIALVEVTSATLTGVTAINSVSYSESFVLGAGLYAVNVTTLNIVTSNFSFNAGSQGGGVYVETSDSVYIYETTFDSNWDPTGSNGAFEQYLGGALSTVNCGNVQFMSSTCTNHQNALIGGCMYLSGGNVAINSSLFSDNTAFEGAAVALANIGVAVIQGCSLTNNLFYFISSPDDYDYPDYYPIPATSIIVHSPYFTSYEGGLDYSWEGQDSYWPNASQPSYFIMQNNYLYQNSLVWAFVLQFVVSNNTFDTTFSDYESSYCGALQLQSSSFPNTTYDNPPNTDPNPPAAPNGGSQLDGLVSVVSWNIFRNSWCNNSDQDPFFPLTSYQPSHLAIYGPTSVIYQANEMDETLYLLSTWFFEFVSVLVLPDPAAPDAATTFPGLSLLNSQIISQTDLVISGQSWFQAVSGFPINILNMTGHQLAFTKGLYYDPSYYYLYYGGPTVEITSMAFFNAINISFVQDTDFCCDTNPYNSPQTTYFFNSSVILYASQVWWFSTWSPVQFDSQSSLVIASGSNVDAWRASGVETPNAPIFGTNVNLYGTLTACDVTVTGNLTTYPGSSLILTASHWRGNDHYMQVNGNVSLQGSLAVMDRLVVLPFTPVITFDFSPAVILVSDYAMSIPSTGAFYSNPYYLQSIGHIQWNLTFTPTAISAFPVKIVPTVTISDDLTYLSVFFIIPTAEFGFPNCTGILADFSQFGDYLACTWITTSIMHITSSSLPLPGNHITWADPRLTNFSVVLLPDYPVDVNAFARPLPAILSECDPLVLDASLTTGIGPFPAFYSWSVYSAFWANDSTYADSTDLSNFLEALDNTSAIAVIPSVQQNSSLLISGVTYQFMCTITSSFQTSGQLDPTQYTITVSPTVSAPSITVIGPLTKSAIFGEDFSIHTIVHYPTCFVDAPISSAPATTFTPPSAIEYVQYLWSYSTDGFTFIDLEVPSSPSLYVPGNSPLMNATNYIGAYSILATISYYDSVLGWQNQSIPTPITLNLQFPDPIILFSSSTNFTDEDVFVSTIVRPSALYDLGYVYSVDWKIFSCPDNYAESTLVFAAPPAAHTPAGHTKPKNGTVAPSAYSPSTVAPVGSVPSAPTTNVTNGLGTCLGNNSQPFNVPLTNNPTVGSLLIPRGSIQSGIYILESHYQFIGLTSGNTDFYAYVAFEYNEVPNTVASPPSVSIIVPDLPAFRANDKLYLEANVSGMIGSELLGVYDLEWVVVSNTSVITANANGQAFTSPSLVIPYASFIPGAWIQIQLAASPVGNPDLRGTTSLNFTTSLAPSGGMLTIDPPVATNWSTTFTIQASEWKAAYYPLRYQFTALYPPHLTDRPLIIPLTELSETDTLHLILPAFTLLGSGIAQIIQIQLTVIDALGSMTVVTSPVTVMPLPDAPFVVLSHFLEDLALSYTTQNWNLGNFIINAMLNLVGPPLTSVDQELLWTLSANASFDLAPAITPSVYGACALLSQINLLAATCPDPALLIQYADKIMFALHAIATYDQSVLGNGVLKGASSAQRFGSGSSFADCSVIGLMDAVDAIIIAGAKLAAEGDKFINYTTDPSTVLTKLTSSILSAMLPFEQAYSKQSTDLAITSFQIPLTNARKKRSDLGTSSPAGPASPASTPTNSVIIQQVPTTTVSIQLNPSSAPTSGSVAVSHTQYTNNSFPYPPSNPATTDVSHLNMGGVPTSGGTAVTTFSGVSQAPSGTSAQCATYNPATKSWTTNSGCTTSTSGDTVTCTCSSQQATSPLTALFTANQSPFNTPNSNLGGLSAGTIAIIAVFSVVGLAIAAVIVASLISPRFRRVFQPFSASSALRQSTITRRTAL